MRDINRIKPMCEELEAIWRVVPDWRMGQLLSNMLGDFYSKYKRDIFFIEDEEFLEYMKEYLKDYR